MSWVELGRRCVAFRQGLPPNLLGIIKICPLFEEFFLRETVSFLLELLFLLELALLVEKILGVLLLVYCRKLGEAPEKVISIDHLHLTRIKDFGQLSVMSIGEFNEKLLFQTLAK